MKIYRIDGNKCGKMAKIGLAYCTTIEIAERYLKQIGFCLETRKWEHIAGHEPGTESDIWYNKKLSDDGYFYDNTSYRYITEINVIEE